MLQRTFKTYCAPGDSIQPTSRFKLHVVNAYNKSKIKDIVDVQNSQLCFPSWRGKTPDTQWVGWWRTRDETFNVLSGWLKGVCVCLILLALTHTLLVVLIAELWNCMLQFYSHYMRCIFKANSLSLAVLSSLLVTTRPSILKILKKTTKR